MTSWNQIGDPAKRAIKVITPVDGETTNDYAEIIDLDIRWLTDTIITIANTEVAPAANELTYKVEVYNDYANGTVHEVTSNTVAVTDSDQVILVRHARVKVSVKATSSGNQTDYQIDVIAGRR